MQEVKCKRYDDNNNDNDDDHAEIVAAENGREKNAEFARNLLDRDISKTEILTVWIVVKIVERLWLHGIPACLLYTEKKVTV